MDDAVLVSTVCCCFFPIACCINNNLSVQRRTINRWLLDFWMQFQHTCGMRRAGHVKRVYISLYMYVYTIYLNYLYIEYEERCTPTALEHLWGKQRVWRLHCTAPSAGRAFFFFFFLPSLEEPLLQFSDRRLESGVRGWIQWAGGRIFPHVHLSALLRGSKSAAGISDRVISAACECTGLHGRLKFICTNHTWGPLDGIKISFLLTCIKFYF